MKELKVGKNEQNQRFDKLLAKYLNLAPISFIYKMLRKKNITLNGKKAAGNEVLKAGDEIKIFLSDETFDKFSSVKSKKQETNIKLPDIPVLYEDENVMFLNKPVGILSQKAAKDDVSANEWVISYLLKKGELSKEDMKTFSPGICNRLDRNTSGILAAGKSLSGLQELSRLFRERTIDKYYYALVSGCVRQGKRIEGYLLKDEKTNQVSIRPEQLPGADRIITAYRPVATNGKETLLDIELVTGKTHQIRAHLSSIGLPIIGDPKYGNVQANRYAKQTSKINRQLLHCHRLHFPAMDGALQNLSGKTIEAPLPEDFLRFMENEQIRQR